VQAKSAGAIAPPPTRYGGGAALQPKIGRTAIAPPPSRYAPALAQTKSAAAPTRAVAPPPSRYAPALAQTKPAAAPTRAVTPPPPPAGGHPVQAKTLRAPPPLQARRVVQRASNWIATEVPEDRVVGFSTSDLDKLRIAEIVQTVFRNIAMPVYLGGGGAVALLGSGRRIKDLDFKMGSALRAAWRDNEQREKIVRALITALGQHRIEAEIEKEDQYVLRLHATFDGGELDISVTTTGEYFEEGTLVATIEGTAGVSMIGMEELLLDKVFAFAERGAGEIDKLMSDFVDIVTLLTEIPGVFPSPQLEARWVAYYKKWRRDRAEQEPEGYAYGYLAPNFGLQVAMRTTVVTTQSDLRLSWGLRRLFVAARQIGTFTRAIEQAVRRDRLLQRDQLLRERGYGTEAYESLSMPEKSGVLRKWAMIKKRMDRLRERGRTKTSEYSSLSRQLFKMNDDFGTPL
jgi:hypothetical protein